MKILFWIAVYLCIIFFLGCVIAAGGKQYPEDKFDDN